MGMRKFMPTIPGIVSAIFTISIANGVLIWLGDSYEIYPEQWIANMIGVAEFGVTDYPGITYILLGFAGLVGLAIGQPIYRWGEKIFSHTHEPTNSFKIELSQILGQIDGFGLLCAINLKNQEDGDFPECLVQVEKLTVPCPNNMPMPLVLRTEGQIRGKRKGRFILDSGITKRIPVLFRSTHRKNEWFFVDENYEINREKSQHFIPAGNIEMVIGVYGGRVNNKILISITTGEDWVINSTIREVSNDYILTESEPEYMSLSDVARLAYDKHKNPDKPEYGLSFVDFNEGYDDSNYGKILNEIASAMSHYVDIYGKHISGSNQIKINLRELKLDNGHDYFGDNGNSIYRINGIYMTKPSKPMWTDIYIKSENINKAVEEIKNYRA